MNRKSKATVLLLLGAASAATPGPSKISVSFPKYSSTSAPALTDFNLDNIKPDYNMSGTTPAGLYRCIRSNLFALPTQTIVNGNGSAASSITAALGTTKSFWATSTAEVGSYESKVA